MNHRRSVVVYRSILLPRSETFVREQARVLGRWHPVLVGERQPEEGIDLSDLDVRMLPAPSGWMAGRLFRLCRRLWLPWWPHLKILRMLRGEFLHVHFGLDAVDVAPYARALGLPMLVTLHGYDISVRREWWESGRGGDRGLRYPQRLLAISGWPGVRFLAVSQALRQRAIEFGIPADRVGVAYIGVDPDRFAPGGLPVARREPRILFVGRMVEKKAPLLMVRAFAKVKERVPDAHLTMAGNGPLAAAAEALALELGVDITFAGAVDTDWVVAEMQRTRIFCLPSMQAPSGDSEGLPIVILEAQACGVPVVTTNHSGNPEAIVPGESGLVVPEGDSEALADSLERLLLDDSMAAAMSRRAREHAVGRFSLRECGRILELEYDRTAGGGEQAGR